jgi:hypothetical protein
VPITLTTKTGVRFEDHPSDPRPVCVDRGHTANSHTVDKGALDENPFVRIWLVILAVLRLVLAPALQACKLIDTVDLEGGPGTQLLFPLVRVNCALGVIMVIAVSCVKLLSAHNSTQHTSRKHKV